MQFQSEYVCISPPKPRPVELAFIPRLDDRFTHLLGLEWIVERRLAEMQGKFFKRGDLKLSRPNRRSRCDQCNTDFTVRWWVVTGESDAVRRCDQCHTKTAGHNKGAMCLKHHQTGFSWGRQSPSQDLKKTKITKHMSPRTPHLSPKPQNGVGLAKPSNTSPSDKIPVGINQPSSTSISDNTVKNQPHTLAGLAKQHNTSPHISDNIGKKQPSSTSTSDNVGKNQPHTLAGLAKQHNTSPHIIGSKAKSGGSKQRKLHEFFTSSSSRSAEPPSPFGPQEMPKKA
ncbi:uncharacterized protein LOC134465344 [Engraulis encrasicolus]|uniref:uncharacterized protein LOC134465344 n=1 Tax=Engraulis encrasicolus TaxID=184585 RepID=UPI002FD5AD0A